MSRRVTHGAVVLSALVLALLLVGGVAAASAGAAGGPGASPTAKVDLGSVAPGRGIRVTGTGWNPSDRLVEIEVCGNLALNGSIDCDVANTDEAAITPDGTFFSAITATAPPSPCPCVVRIGYTSLPDIVKLPIVIEGVGQRPPELLPQVTRQVSVSAVYLEGSGPWWSWFGAAPRRRVVYTVVNTGDVVLDDPALTVSFGRGRQPSGFVNAPEIGELNVGQSKTFSARLPFSAPSFGSYTVTVYVDPLGQVGAGQATTAVVPWGLIVAVAVVLQVLVLRVWADVRRRRAVGGEGTAAEDVADGPDVGGMVVWDAAGFVDSFEPMPYRERPLPVVEVEHEWAGPWWPIARGTPITVESTSSPTT